MKKVLSRLFVVFCLVTSSLLVAPFSVSAEPITGFDYDNYYELEYLEGDGNAYILTSWYYYTTTAYLIEFKASASKSISTYETLYGVYNNNSSGAPWSLWAFTDNQIHDYVTNQTWALNSTPRTYSISRNGQSYNSNTYMSIFKANYYGTGNTYSGVNGLRIYYFDIFVNQTKYRHLIPAERKSDNVLGLYDTIGERFYTNDGSGSFVGGPRVNVTQYTITTNVSPSGSGNVTGGGIYDSGDVVTLTAIPESGYTFDHWNDGSIQNPLTVTATSDITYTAYFVGSSPPQTQYTITTNVSPSGSGTVSGGGTYSSGTGITLSAVPNNGYVFSQWSDGVTTPSRSLIVNGDASYTAIFEVIPPTYYTITTNVSPNGSGTVSGGGSYLSGTTVTLSAAASNGYRFSSWSDGNSDNPRTVVLTSDFNITAYFVDESIVNNIIVGYNVNIIDVDNTYVVTSFSGTAYDRQGTQQTYELDLSSVTTYNSQNWIYQLDVILNNDYIGLANIVYNNGQFTRQVFFNGNHFTVNQQTAAGNPFSSVTISFSSIVLNDKYQGTPESADSVIDVTDKNDEFNEQANDLYTYEGQFNEDLNDTLEDIQVNFDIGTQFGSKFLASANWVKSQFDTLTSNTPFGTVLSFSLVLGIALLIIGKAIK